MCPEFQVPDADDVHALLGLRMASGKELGVSTIAFEPEAGGAWLLTLDEFGRAVALSLTQNHQEIVHIFREGATRMRVFKQSPEIVIEFDTETARGRLEVSITPGVRVRESTLLV